LTRDPPTDETALLHRGGRPAGWGNLGLWPAAGAEPVDYATAAEALACAVGEAAGLRPGQRVLSVASGAGDELVLWAEAFGVAEAWGLEPDLQRTTQAQDRIERWKASRMPSDGVRLHTVAADLQGLESLAGALGPIGPFDAIVCVDALYHLAPRADTLRRLAKLLRHGGRLAFTDLVPRHGGLRGRLLRALADRAGLVGADWIGPQAWPEALRAAGLTLRAIDDLDGPVLDGFVHFVERQQRLLGADAAGPGWQRVRDTARLLPVARRLGLGKVRVVAERTRGPGE
jgi:SAM-dependent methyltransferase